MNTHIIKKAFLGLALTSALAISACGSDSDSETKGEDNTVVQVKTSDGE